MAFLKNMMASLKSQAENGIINIAGDGPPTNATTGYGVTGKGSAYYDKTNGVIYINTGTITAPVWTPEFGPTVGMIARGTIVPADIVGTGAGQLGHANGYPLVAAPGAVFMLELLSAVFFYDFITAAYTAGGNVTINWGAGGAAITGLISAANSFGAAADKQFQLNPLAAAALALVLNAGINLVAAAAFTQPGTAAGIIYYTVNYRIHPTTF